jgi:rSAM/selenodomain-associated transferase 1
VREHVLIFVRAPVPGQVKTRLARALGDNGAATLYRAMGRTIVDRLRSPSAPWHLEAWYTPATQDAARMVSDWLDLSALALHPQEEGSLGHRMDRAIADAFERGATRVCLVGSDIPDLDATHVAEAFRALDGGTDVVLGPCEDGGYYLVGLRAAEPRLFEGVAWSTATVLADTLQRASAAGMRVHLLPELRDVDEVEDLDPTDR